MHRLTAHRFYVTCRCETKRKTAQSGPNRRHIRLGCFVGKSSMHSINAARVYEIKPLSFFDGFVFFSFFNFFRWFFIVYWNVCCVMGSKRLARVFRIRPRRKRAKSPQVRKIIFPREKIRTAIINTLNPLLLPPAHNHKLATANERAPPLDRVAKR